MNRKPVFRFLFLVAGLLGLSWIHFSAVHACGGLFCRNNPVDQNAERIIFVQNDDGTVSAIIQIQYTGFDEDFSWILPLPHPISADAIEVPETAATAFTELELATNPVYIPPPTPDCAQVVFEEEAIPASAGGVEVFASGEVGPYGFDVVGSDDPDALVTWLKEHGYRITPEMEPLVDVYVAEQFVFLAMRLQPDQGVQDIQPVQVTYPSERPMIPLRLTAVAANPDMAVITWVFADNQAVPTNYAHMEIPDEEIVFYTFGGNNYRQLMGDKANQSDGKAFVTEYAAPSSEMSFSDPLLQELSQKHRYLTRLNTVISPEEMTVDPVFDYDADRPNVSNIHDLSGWSGLYDCEQQGISNIFNPVSGPSSSAEEVPGDNRFTTGLLVGGGVVLFALIVLGIGVILGRRSRG